MGVTNDEFSLGDTSTAHLPGSGGETIHLESISHDGLWYADQVLRATGWTHAQFHHYARKRLFKSVRRGTDGHKLYDPQEIRECAAGRPRPAKTFIRAKRIIEANEYGYTSSEAKEIIDAFHSGQTLAEVSRKNTHVHPRVLMQIFKDYTRLTQSIILSPAVVTRINALDLDCAMPVKNEVDIFRALQSAEKERCHSSGCNESRSGRCEKCIRKRVLKSLTVRQRHGLDPVTKEDAERIVAEPETPEKYQGRIHGR